VSDGSGPTAVAPRARESAPGVGIEIVSLTRLYGELAAVDEVTVSIAPGELVALMGHNGAGKSTLLRMVAGLTRPTSGEVRVDGLSVRTDLGARARLGLLAHESYLYPALTARENLALYATLFDLPDATDRVDAVLAEVGLDWARDLPVEGFSRGMEQRAALARVLLHDPSVLLLDEPFAGLDRAAEQFLLQKLAALSAAGKTALLVTHDPFLAARAAERAVVLRRGRVALDTPLAAAEAAAFTARFTELLEEGGRR